MKKLFLVLFLFILSQGIFSQEQNIIPEKKTQKGFIAIDFLSIDMPLDEFDNDEPNMGLTGIHYNLKFKEFYAGLGIYGAVSGIRGGLFTLGVNAGFRKNLTDRLFLDTGFHFGGGGGASAPDGGGAFILPHFNIGYQFKRFSIATGYSYVNFFDSGNIKSHQFHVALQVPLSLDYSDYEYAEKELPVEDLKKTGWNQNSASTSLMIHLNNLSVIGDSQDTNGVPLEGNTIRLAGFELNSYMNKKLFFFLKADGAYHGIKAGYMNVFLGAGYQFSFNKKRTNILTKFGVGAGGGGGVDTQGGFLIYPDVSIEQKLFNNMFLSINKGYLMNPNAHFITSTFGVGLKFYSDRSGIISDEKSFSNAIFKGYETIIKESVYFNAKRDNNPTENLYQISLQINFNLNKHIYLAGQTSFANFGNAGAYAEGIVGLGVKSKAILNNKVDLFAQALVGAAGGGDISTGQGLIAKPSAGFNYRLNTRFSLMSSVGYVKAIKGELSSPFFNFGLKYNVSFLTVN